MNRPSSKYKSDPNGIKSATSRGRARAVPVKASLCRFFLQLGTGTGTGGSCSYSGGGWGSSGDAGGAVAHGANAASHAT